VSVREVERKIEALEVKLGAKEEKITLDMWDGDSHALFGHVHYSFHKATEKTEIVPFTDEEEMAWLRGDYEEAKAEGRVRFNVKSFVEYMQKHDYLCSEESLPRFKVLLEKERRKHEKFGCSETA
jgi:hypothetical protein